MGLRLGFAKTTTSDNRAEEFSAGDGNYGDIIPYGFGTRTYIGKPIWATAVEERETKSSKKKGGFLGIGYTKVTTITYDYYATFAVSFCVGPTKRLVKLWLNDELVYDGTNYFDNEDPAPVQQQKFLFASQRAQQFNLQQDKRVPYRFYKGDETQVPDPTIAAIETEVLTPAYRGQVYMVFDRLNLKQFNDQIPTVKAEIQMDAGAQDAAVTITPLTQNADFDSNFGDFNVDWRRGLIYSGNTDIDITESGLAVWNTDGVLIRKVGRTDQSGAQAGILAMDYDFGEYYTKNFDAEASAFKVNGYTGIEVDEKDGSPPFVIAVPSGVVIRSSIGSQDRLIFSSDFRGAHVMDHGLGLVSYVNTRLDDEYADPFANDLVTSSSVAPAGLDNSQYAYTMLIDKQSPESAPDGTARIVRANAGLAVQRVNVFGLMFPFTFGFSEFTTGNESFGDDRIIYTLNFDNGNNRVIGFLGGLDLDTGDPAICVFAWSEVEGIVWQTRVPFAPQTGNAFSRLQGGYYAWHNGTRICAVDLNTGVLDAKFNGVNNEYIDLGSPTNQVYDDTTSTLLSWGRDVDDNLNTLVKVRLFLGNSGSSTLAAIVRKLANVSGLVEGEDYDVSGVEGIEVPGYIADKMIESRKLIEPLIEFFQVTVAEIDHRLVFTTRQTEPLDTIFERDLIAGSPAFKRERAEEKTLPRKYEVRYLDKDQEHRPGLQTSVRPLYPEPTTGSQSAETFELAISMSATPAKQQTEKLLYSSWIERVGYDFNLPQRFLRFTVGDVVTFEQESGYSSMVLFDNISVGANFQMKTHSVEQSAGQYVSTAVGRGGSTFDMPLTLSVPSEAFYLDIPLLQDADQSATPGISIAYWSAGNYGFLADAWPGADLMRSYDNFTFERKDSSLIPAVWGSTISIFPEPASPHSLDDVSTLDVSVASGFDQLVSVTESEMYEGKNRAIITHQDGTSEIISYQTVTPLSDNTVRLSRFLRGRRGTDTQMGGAGYSDQIIFLTDDADQDTANYTYFGNGIAETLAATDNQYYKVITRGLDPSEVEGTQFTYTCADLKPYAPTNLRAVQIESTGDFELRWTRRTRVGGALSDSGDVPLSEATEAYSIDIYDPTGATILRTLTSSTPEVSYAVADITSDYGEAEPVEIIFAVYQLSADVGRGFGQATTVEVNY